MQNRWDAIESDQDYVPCSLKFKTNNHRSAILEWFINVEGVANIKERFYQLKMEQKYIMDKEVLSEIDIE